MCRILVIERNTMTFMPNDYYDYVEPMDTDTDYIAPPIDILTNDTFKIITDMVNAAESTYKNMHYKKLYVDLLAAYAKTILDPYEELFDMNSALQNIKNYGE